MIITSRYENHRVRVMLRLLLLLLLWMVRLLVWLRLTLLLLGVALARVVPMMLWFGVWPRSRHGEL